MWVFVFSHGLRLAMWWSGLGLAFDSGSGGFWFWSVSRIVVRFQWLWRPGVVAVFDEGDEQFLVGDKLIVGFVWK